MVEEAPAPAAPEAATPNPAAESSEAPPVVYPAEDNLGIRGGVAAWCEYAFTRALLGSASRLPRGIQRRVVSVLARLAARIDRRHSGAARSFQAQALGPASGPAEEDARVVGAYRHLFQISLDADAFDRHVPADRVREHFVVNECEGFRELVASGGGGILVSPHVGDWESGSALVPHMGLKPFYGLARPPRNRYLSRHLLHLRERRGVYVMPRRGGMNQAGKILAAGGWIGMLLDQRPSGKHVLAPFFDRLVPCERGAGVLIKRLKVPLVFGACYLTDRPFHYEEIFTRVVLPEELESMSIEEVATRVNVEMERLILRKPEQYFWLHDRFRHAPPIDAGPVPTLDDPVPTVDDPRPPAGSQEGAGAGSAG